MNKNLKNLKILKKTEDWVNNIPVFDDSASSVNKNTSENGIEADISSQGTSNGRKKRKNRPNSHCRRRKLRKLDPMGNIARANIVKQSTLRMKRVPPGSDILYNDSTSVGYMDSSSSVLEEAVPVSDNECEVDISDSREKLADFDKYADDEFIINEQLPRREDHIIGKDNNSQWTVVCFAGHRIRGGCCEFDVRFKDFENE
jgi:hypothetical protein